jgi:hypothetical protein
MEGYWTIVLLEVRLFLELLCKGQTGQQLLLGAYSAMNRQIGRGKINAPPSRNA